MGSSILDVYQAKLSCGAAGLVAVETEIKITRIFPTKTNEMFFSLTSLAVMLSLASSAPLNTEDVVDIIESQHDLDNSINVDERPNKQVEIDSETPLGSQFAVEFFFPERKNLETGRRIPLHLFPVETQNKILEVEQEEEEEEVIPTQAAEKYIDSSSFRQSQPESPSHVSAVDISLRNLFSPGLETDRTYQDTLSVFAPPSFFS